jgi:hypothetical protein
MQPMALATHFAGWRMHLGRDMIKTRGKYTIYKILIKSRHSVTKLWQRAFGCFPVNDAQGLFHICAITYPKETPATVPKNAAFTPWGAASTS